MRAVVHDVLDVDSFLELRRAYAASMVTGLGRLAGRTVGPDAPPYVVAEIGANHNGDMALCRRLVDAAVDAGADLLGFIFAEGSPRRAPGVLDVPDERLSVAVYVGEADENEHRDAGQMGTQPFGHHCSNRQIALRT